MKVQAVTICINYSDYFACILDNFRHFDRWVVMTVREDRETQRLCEKHGIESRASRRLRPDGSDFNAAWNKARVINEGLDIVDPHGWGIVIDGDILLPRHFRERIEGLHLESGCLYGLRGRRICSDPLNFYSVRDCEPWESTLEQNTQPLGYFNLFDLEHPLNRYCEEPFNRLRPHDDTLFAARFPRNARHLLPFSALHVGAVQSNWDYRRTRPYVYAPSDADPPFGSSPTANPRNTKCGAVVGYFPGGLWRVFAEQFQRLYLVDQYNIHQESVDADIECDRIVLRRLLESESRDLGNLIWLGQYASGTLSRIPDDSLDLIFFAGGSAHESFIAAFPEWKSKLREEATVCGDMFLHAEWYEGVISVSSLFGTPDEVTPRGHWWKRFSHTAGPIVRRPVIGPGIGNSGVVIVISENDDLEPAYLSMHSVRLYWGGKITVFYAGEDHEALTIACCRLGCDLQNFGGLSVGSHLNGSDLITAASLQHFARAIILRPGMLAVAALAPLLSNPKRGDRWSGDGPVFAERTRAGLECFTLPFSSCQEISVSANIVVCEGRMDYWTDAVWEEWSSRKVAIIEEMATEIRLRNDTTIVVIVGSESYGDFQHNWLHWKFRPLCSIALVLVNISKDDLWLPGERRPAHVLSIPDAEGANMTSILQWIMEVCSSETVIFLPPTSAPLPGAELWVSREWDRYQVVRHVPAIAVDELQITGNQFIPEPLMALVRTEYIPVLVEKACRLYDVSTLAQLFFFAAAMDPDASGIVDLAKWGWRNTQTFTYVPMKLLENNGVAKTST